MGGSAMLVNNYDGARATTESLDLAWKLHLGDVTGAQATTFDDSSWTAVISSYSPFARVPLVARDRYVSPRPPGQRSRSPRTDDRSGRDRVAFRYAAG